MKKTIFNSNTGKHMYAGYDDSPKFKGLEKAGHTVVEGYFSSDYMYSNRSVILDAEKATKKADADAKKQEDKIRRDEILALLGTNHGDRSKDSETIGLLNELARL